MLEKLELKLPPALLVLIIALIMWFIANNFSTLSLPTMLRYLGSGLLLFLSVLIIGLGGFNFKKANTTVNPTTPNSSTALVTTGIYRYSRNPMYIGFLLMLMSWAVFLSSLLALIMVPVYVVYMNHFQIQPEERALASIFGDQFSLYKSKVRRWL